MSGIGTGLPIIKLLLTNNDPPVQYDIYSSTYSPDGRIFQIEYANKAVENSGTAIGLRVKDGVVLAVEKLVQSKLIVAGSNRRIQSADLHIGMVSAGLQADGRYLVQSARDEASSWRDNYRQPIPGKSIADRLGLFVQAHTLYSSVRPLGAGTIIATYLDGEPTLHMIEPSGVYWGYRGCAVGKGKSVAKTEIEKLKLDELSVRDAVREAARIIHTAHDEAKDKDFELEMTWICEESKGKHVLVPKEITEEAERLAKESIKSEMEDA